MPHSQASSSLEDAIRHAKKLKQDGNVTIISIDEGAGKTITGEPLEQLLRA